jgi:putative salt-induced outer membrane protein YdiY
MLRVDSGQSQEVSLLRQPRLIDSFPEGKRENPGKRAGRRASVFLLVFASAFIPYTRAQDKPPEKKLGWGDSAELAYVATSGNSEVNTLGFKNTLSRTWDNALLEIRAAGIRSESTLTSHVVSSAGPPVEISESSASQLTAENYLLNGKYSRDIAKAFYWYGFAGWERNRFSGIENRTTVAGGVGNIWRDTDRLKFRTDYSATYTNEQDVVEPPGFDGTFAGVRVTSTYQQSFGAVTVFGDDFIFDEDLSTPSNWRGDMANWVSVTMAAHLALKVSLRWLYDNQPAQAAAQDPQGLLPPGSVALYDLDKLDSIFTASLVVKY